MTECGEDDILYYDDGHVHFL